MTGFRKYGRHKINAAIELVGEGYGDLTAQIRDISDGGVFIRNRELCKKISIGQSVEAKLYVPASNCSVAVVSLRAVRCSGEGMAFSFE